MGVYHGNKIIKFVLDAKKRQIFGWLDNILDALDEKTSRVESAKHLLMHIGSLKKYRDVFAEVGEELGLTMIPRLDKATLFEIQSLSNILTFERSHIRRNL